METVQSMRETLREHLLRLDVRALEERDRVGYSKLPQELDEAVAWEAEASWRAE